MDSFTKAEKLLIAAGALHAKGIAEFTSEDLVVEAFKLFPNDFSLKGHPEYPDNNSVLTLLMGRNARLIVTGWLQKTGTKKYRLTPKGLDDLEARRPGVARSAGESNGPVRSERKREEALGQLFQSDAFELFRNEKGDSVTFHQFCRFLGLAAPDKWQKIQGKIEEARHLAFYTCELGEARETLRIHFRGVNREYAPRDLILLATVLETLLKRFDPEMKAWYQKLHPSP